MKDDTTNPNGNATQPLPSKPNNDACEQSVANNVKPQPSVQKNNTVDTSQIKYGSPRISEKPTFHNK